MNTPKSNRRRLLYPYDMFESYGPTYHSTQNRYYLSLQPIDGVSKTSTVSYARYLMSVKLGRMLDKDLETVDHIDNDPTNDVYENLQLLTKEENNKKSSELGRFKKLHYKVTCPMCSTVFEKPDWKVKSCELILCSKRCRGLFTTYVKNGTTTREECINKNIRIPIEYNQIVITNKHQLHDFKLVSGDVGPVVKNINNECATEVIEFIDYADRSRGVYINNGYRYIMAKKHPKANYKGYISEHLYVYEMYNKMYVPNGFVVYHLDCDPLNNDPDNLIMLSKRDGVVFRSSFLFRDKSLFNKKTEYKRCCICDYQLITKEPTTTCSEVCHNIYTRRNGNKPDKQKLSQLLENNSFEAVGKMFSVTGNAVRKWCRTYGIDPKQIHKEKIFKPFVRKCSQCGADVNITSREDADREHVFCSRSCASKHYYESNLDVVKERLNHN